VNHACHKHPNSTVRPFRADGPNGRTVYLQCFPTNGAPHLLASATAGERDLTIRAGEEPALPASVTDMPETPLPFGLTQAELVVLRAAAHGLTVPETARQLHKGAETVKTQRNKIILKIGARNMTHAVCIATETGLVSAAA
jgi:DNA-binding NarL/FixJ family response regulator